MGHIGLTPQSATKLGGFKAQGRSAEAALALLADARALEAAGCFSLVLEAVPAPVAKRISERLAMPTIGIGAGADTDGQVLVWHDLLGLYEGRVAALRQALCGDRRDDPRLHSRRTPRTCASAVSRRSGTRTRCPTRSSRSSRRAGRQSTNASTATIASSSAAAAPTVASERSQSHPCNDAYARGRGGQRPGPERELGDERTVAPAPSSAPPAWNCRPRRARGAA